MFSVKDVNEFQDLITGKERFSNFSYEKIKKMMHDILMLKEKSIDTNGRDIDYWSSYRWEWLNGGRINLCIFGSMSDSSIMEIQIDDFDANFLYKEIKCKNDLIELTEGENTSLEEKELFAKSYFEFLSYVKKRCVLYQKNKKENSVYNIKEVENFRELITKSQYTKYLSLEKVDLMMHEILGMKKDGDGYKFNSSWNPGNGHVLNLKYSDKSKEVRLIIEGSSIHLLNEFNEYVNNLCDVLVDDICDKHISKRSVSVIYELLTGIEKPEKHISEDLNKELVIKILEKVFKIDEDLMEVSREEEDIIHISIRRKDDSNCPYLVIYLDTSKDSILGVFYSKAWGDIYNGSVEELSEFQVSNLFNKDVRPIILKEKNFPISDFVKYVSYINERYMDFLKESCPSENIKAFKIFEDFVSAAGIEVKELKDKKNMLHRFLMGEVDDCQDITHKDLVSLMKSEYDLMEVAYNDINSDHNYSVDNSNLSAHIYNVNNIELKITKKNDNLISVSTNPEASLCDIRMRQEEIWKSESSYMCNYDPKFINGYKIVTKYFKDKYERKGDKKMKKEKLKKEKLPDKLDRLKEIQGNDKMTAKEKLAEVKRLTSSIVDESIKKRHFTQLDALEKKISLTQSDNTVNLIEKLYDIETRLEDYIPIKYAEGAVGVYCDKNVFCLSKIKKEDLVKIIEDIYINFTAINDLGIVQLFPNVISILINTGVNEKDSYSILLNLHSSPASLQCAIVDSEKQDLIGCVADCKCYSMEEVLSSSINIEFIHSSINNYLNAKTLEKKGIAPCIITKEEWKKIVKEEKLVEKFLEYSYTAMKM